MLVKIHLMDVSEFHCLFTVVLEAKPSFFHALLNNMTYIQNMHLCYFMTLLYFFLFRNLLLCRFTYNKLYLLKVSSIIVRLNYIKLYFLKNIFFVTVDSIFYNIEL